MRVELSCCDNVREKDRLRDLVAVSLASRVMVDEPDDESDPRPVPEADWVAADFVELVVAVLLLVRLGPLIVTEMDNCRVVVPVDVAVHE